MKLLKLKCQYSIFLYSPKSDEIKDIDSNKIDYVSLKNIYKKFEIKKSNLLQYINKNIKLYSKIDNNLDNFIETSKARIKN